MLRRVDEAHRVERLLPSYCRKMQMARMISKQTGQPLWPTLNTSIRVLYDSSAVISLVVTAMDSRTRCIILRVAMDTEPYPVVAGLLIRKAVTW